MSPAGISVFYGALDRKTCISEIRPLVGDMVVSAEFRAMAELKLLDLNALSNCAVLGDVYDSEFVRHAHATEFFKELIFQMSRPVRRGDGGSYLSTQFIFEYIRVKFFESVDGVIYSSVQQDQAGECMALFPENSFASPEGVFDLQGCLEDPFLEKDNFKIFYVPESIRYHRIRAVSYVSEDDEDSFKLLATDALQKFSGTRF